MLSAHSFIHLSPVSHDVNPSNVELNPICHLLALLGTHHILHVSRIRANKQRRKHFNFGFGARYKLKVKCPHCNLTLSPGRGVEVYLYSFSLTSALDGVFGQRHPRLLYSRERPGTHGVGPQCQSGWVQKISPHRNSIPGPSSS